MPHKCVLFVYFLGVFCSIFDEVNIFYRKSSGGFLTIFETPKKIVQNAQFYSVIFYSPDKIFFEIFLFFFIFFSFFAFKNPILLYEILLFPLLFYYVYCKMRGICHWISSPDRCPANLIFRSVKSVCIKCFTLLYISCRPISRPNRCHRYHPYRSPALPFPPMLYIFSLCSKGFPPPRDNKQ